MNKAERRARRRRIIRRAVALAKELHSEDEEARRDFVIQLINKAVDIPGLTERMEERILKSVIDLIIDLASEEDEIK